MTAHSTRARRHGLGALGVAATLLVALASTASATTPPDSTTPADGSAAPADTAGGDAAADLEALYAAAQEEGQVNLIALPDNWANYGGILQSFRDKYPGIDNPVQTPMPRSAEELTAVETQRGSDTMPDSIDVGPPFALQAVEEGIWDPYMPTVWDEIPDALKDPDGNWVAAYYGIMSIGTNTTLVADAPTSFADLNDPQYAGQVALNGDPREAGAAFAGVWAAALANGGSFDDIMPGIEYFADLKEQGILILIAADDNTILSGETPIVLDWTYNWPGRLDAIAEAGFEWSSAVPSDGVYGSYYAQGVVADSPAPQRRPPVDRAHPVRRGCPRLPRRRRHPGSLRDARRERHDHRGHARRPAPGRVDRAGRLPDGRPDRCRPGTARRELGADGRRHLIAAPGTRRDVDRTDPSIAATALVEAVEPAVEPAPSGRARVASGCVRKQRRGPD